MNRNVQVKNGSHFQFRNGFESAIFSENIIPVLLNLEIRLKRNLRIYFF